MKRKFISIFIALVLAVSLMLVPAAVSAGPGPSIGFWEPGDPAAGSTVEYSTNKYHSPYHSVYLKALKIESPTDDNKEIYVGEPTGVTTLNSLTNVSFWYYAPEGGDPVPPEIDIWLDTDSTYSYGPPPTGDDEWLLGQIPLVTTFDEWVEVPLSDIEWIRAMGGEVYGWGSDGLDAAKVALGDYPVLAIGIQVGGPATRHTSRVGDQIFYVDDLTINDVTYDLGPTSGVGLTADIPDIIGISVTPTGIDFGTLYPGNIVSGSDLTVENIGTVTVVVDAELAPLTGTVFNYLKLGGDYSPSGPGIWDDIISSLLPNTGAPPLTTALHVPSTYSAQGEETATLIFIATPKEEEEPGQPLYGGTLTVCTGYGDAPNADITAEGTWPAVYYATPVLDYLITGDIDQYGSRGTNEFPFRLPRFVPEEFCRGNLVESWEITPNQIVFHIRPGVFWQAMGKEHMESREYTAHDTVFSLIHYMESPVGHAMLAPYDWINSIYATDRYTCVVETSFFNANWKWLISTGWGNAQYAAEVVAAGASDWNNLVGTGPFMLKEYISGSRFSYERNPDYWDTTVIDGIEYIIPFIDELVYPIIPDEATRIAALRTGKLDYMTGVSLQYEDDLALTCPDLIKIRMLSSEVRLIGLRCDEPPFSYKQVRQAMMIGTDREAIAKALFIEAGMYSWPISPQVNSVYTPFNELPESTRDLFEYNPELAIEMLADAGYVEGFKLSMPILAGEIDVASMVRDWWAKIGVEVTINVMDAAAYFDLISTRQGYDVMTTTNLTTNPLITLRNEFLPGERRNFANYDNPYFTNLYQEAVQTMDPAQRNAMLRELAVIGLDDVPYIPIGAPLQLICSWPWIKNYYGQLEESAWGTAHINARIWIDQVLKAEMGY